jgi:hypothetical protein
LHELFIENKLTNNLFFHIVARDHNILCTLIDIYLNNEEFNDTVYSILSKLIYNVCEIKLPSQYTINYANMVACMNTYMSNPLKFSPKIENNQHQWNKVKLDRLLDLLDIFYSSHMTPSNITSPKYNIVKHKDSPGLKLSNLAKISDYAQNDDILDPVKSLALDWCHQGFST